LDVVPNAAAANEPLSYDRPAAAEGIIVAAGSGAGWIDICRTQ